MKTIVLLALGATFIVGCNGSFDGGGLGTNTGGAGATGGGAAGTSVVTGAAGAAGAAGITSPSGGAGTQGSLPTGACGPDVLPADVMNLLATRCIACHGNPPLGGVPASFTSYASVTAKSKTDPTKTNAQLAVERLQSATMPMPPAPLMRATAAELATLQQWVAAGSPAAACAPGVDAGASGDGSVSIPDPFAAAPLCTSKKTWTGGNKGSSAMNPGIACIACHDKGGDGPRYALAGTLYPTAHEPDLCDGVPNNAGAQIVIVGANGQTVTMTPNTAGNFFYQGALSLPYQAKIVYMGRERAMIEPQTSGDCNACHTQDGSMPSGTLKAPGRILLP
jgi:hypothetical protein